MSKTFDEDYLNYNTKFQKNAEQQHKVYADKNNAAGTAYINDMNTVIDANTQRATEKIEGQISALPQHYQSGYESNAIQQKINERQLAERMANMGLTNSGLNRTQQTAINIQRSNADAALTRQKNAAMASLRSQIADVIANANSEKNTLAAQSKYDTATRNNEMYASFMNQADQRAYDRAVTLDNQRFSATEAEKDRTASANAAYIKKGLEDGSLVYDDKGNIIAANTVDNVINNKPTDEDYKNIVNQYLIYGGYTADGATKFNSYLDQNYSDYDREAIIDYLDGIVAGYHGGNNWGGGIDKNATVRINGVEISMKDLYDQLIAAGFSKGSAKDAVIAFQKNKGLVKK